MDPSVVFVVPLAGGIVGLSLFSVWRAFARRRPHVRKVTTYDVTVTDDNGRLLLASFTSPAQIAVVELLALRLNRAGVPLQINGSPVGERPSEH